MLKAVLPGFIRRSLTIQPGVRLLQSVTNPEENEKDLEAIEVELRDGRELQATYDSVASCFAATGFALIKHPTKMLESDWADFAKVKELYLKEIENLVHTQLQLVGDIDSSVSVANRRGPGNLAYARGVHQDYGITDKDYVALMEAYGVDAVGAAWAQQLATDKVRGYCSINFWRSVLPMKGPLQTTLLALLDPQSVAPEDIIETGATGSTPTGKPTVQLGLKYNPEQKWYYFPDMMTDEVLAFRQFNWIKGAANPLATCFHSAFENPNPPAGAEPRHSAEYRVGVWLE
eukprot:TRINITY_DN106763_c0_g1_i1.p1 TRINITY_DN106763_c0_g1~~TRINITY_DN106763_c0_g1_i1.p1  ORF type:complete len:309 (-),score=30.37 TRINITY_DN106763_c0_g1_i1:394-1260(-)